jgi:hypothetical protein
MARLRDDVELATVAAVEATVRDAIAPATFRPWLRPEGPR